MHSFLFISKDSKICQQIVREMIDKFNISPFNFHEIVPVNSIGIADVRNLNRILIQKPYHSQKRLIVLKQMEKATLEAQNALLKLLEEPTFHTYIILLSNNINKLLPTVVSRCQIIRRGKEYKQNIKGKYLQNGQEAEQYKILQELMTASSGERLIFCQNKIKDKQQASQFLENISMSIQRNLEKDFQEGLKIKEMAKLLAKIESARKFIEGNINYKLVVDILLLGLPQK